MWYLVIIFKNFLSDDVDRREAERGRFNNEAIRRFQMSDGTPSDFLESSSQNHQNANFKTNYPTNYGSSSEETALNVESMAPILVKATTFVGDAIHKQVGETLRLECLVDGVPPPNIIWYKVRSKLCQPCSVTRRRWSSVWPDWLRAVWPDGLGHRCDQIGLDQCDQMA